VQAFSKLFQLVFQRLNSLNLIFTLTNFLRFNLYRSIESCYEESIRDLVFTKSFINLIGFMLPLV